MSVRPTLLKDMRRTAVEKHLLAAGTGNYNRFAPIGPRDRSFSTGKRHRSAEPVPPAPKAPRLDANTVFAQLKDQETTLAEATTLLKLASETSEECCSEKDGAIGTIIHSLLKVMAIMITSHQNITSAIVDSVKLSETSTAIPTSATYGKDPATKNSSTGAVPKNNNRPEKAAQPAAKPPSEEDLTKRRVRQVLREAEKRTLIFNLDMGQVPTINKDTLSRKVTMALSDKAKSGNHDYNTADAEEAIDDVLSCAKLEFLGTQSRKFFNRKNASDTRNNTFCTLPVRMDFKDKATRIQAEIAMRKICKVSCSTPYPKRLRTMLDNLVKEGKARSPDSFIRTRVNADKLTIDVHAKVGESWVDLGLSCEVPLMILNPDTPLLDAATLEAMEQELAMDQATELVTGAASLPVS